ncbi:MAG TPA: DOMON-like domain-containing protein [Rhizomicrobium sp.]|nr:DOMON-like domain-containing protein [Rhizomicrobium sp.]
MRRALVCHANTPCEAIVRIDVDAGWGADGIDIRYFVRGAILDVSIPAPSAPLRTDGLWQHTCFEAFVRAEQGEAYCEFNFSPSTAWAAYRFDDHRSGMRPIDKLPALPIASEDTEIVLSLRATLPRRALADWAGAGSIKLGLSAVIEERSGRKSYWALVHPPGDPDFHHRDCFALVLPAN